MSSALSRTNSKAMLYRGYVDSEGGPLIIGDVVTLQKWRGDNVAGSDYNGIATALSNASGLGVPVADDTIVIWDCGGAGTTDVYSDENDTEFLLVRSWLEETDETEFLLILSALPRRLTEPFAELRVTTGKVGVLWSAENGDSIHYSNADGWFLDREQMMTKSCGLLLALSNGCYQCFYDEVETEGNRAIRCHILRKAG